jgi:hypothetical protein
LSGARENASIEITVQVQDRRGNRDLHAASEPPPIRTG